MHFFFFFSFFELRSCNLTDQFVIHVRKVLESRKDETRKVQSYQLRKDLGLYEVW